MSTWNVSAGTRSVLVEASNWLGALGLALPELGLSAGALGRLVCSVSSEGGAEAYDPIAGVRLRVLPARPASEPSAALADDDALEMAESEEDAAPEIVARVHPRLGEIHEATDGAAACRAALCILADVVPADAGAVLVRTRSGGHLRFAAASGPSAQGLVGTHIPVDEGIAGFVHGFGMGVIVSDTRRDTRHYKVVDRTTGYRTEAVLAVPIKGPGGASLGCIELLNPSRAFEPADLGAADAVAGALGAWLGGVRE